MFFKNKLECVDFIHKSADYFRQKLTNIQPEDFSKEHSEINKCFTSKELRKIAKMVRLDLWVEAQNYVEHSVFRINKRNLIQLLVEWRAEPSFEHTEWV